MTDLDINSDAPLPASPAALSFDTLLADAHATMAERAARPDPRKPRAEPRADPHGTRTVEEDRIRYRQTFTKLRYVLIEHVTVCLCGVQYFEPQGIYEESQSSKGGATNLAMVVATSDATLPRVVRRERHQCNICASCATNRHGFSYE